MRKKVLKKILSVILSIIMLLSVTAMLSAETFDDFAATVYLNGVSGSDSNTGLTEAAAVKSIEKAYEILYTKMGSDLNNIEAKGKIVVSGNTAITTANWKLTDKHGFTLHITSKTGGEGFTFPTSSITMPGPTVFEDITLTYTGTSTSAYLCGGGYPLTIGENVTTVPNSKSAYYSLAGGNFSSVQTGDTNLTVNSGTWRTVCAGSYNSSSSSITSGNATLVINGGEVTGNVTASYSSYVNGNLNIAINGGTIGGIRFGLGKYVSTTKRAVSGDINFTAGNCTIGDITSIDCGGSFNADLYADSGKILSLAANALDCNTFTGGGTLSIPASSTYTFKTVSGSTAVEFTGELVDGAQLKAGSSSAENAFTSNAAGFNTYIKDNKRVWGIGEPVEDPALVITAPSAVTLTLKTGFSGGTEIAPTEQTTVGNKTTYIFRNLTSGQYRYTVKGAGYYTVTKQINYLASTRKEMDADHGKNSGTARFDPSTAIELVEYTDEVLAGPLASSKDMFGEYNKIFTTPVFTNTNRANHQATTQEEMLDYIDSLDNIGDDMYTYNLGNTAKNNYEIPLCIFTKLDLSAATTIEEAESIIKTDTNKPLVYITAQIHGNEVAATEGALAMMTSLQGEYGENILDYINILYVPRVNPEGTRIYSRRNSDDIDMNRDNLLQETYEAQLVHNVFNIFKPHVIIDQHEYVANTTSNSNSLDDVYVGFNQNPNTSDRNNAIVDAASHSVIDKVLSNGLRGFYYTETGPSTTTGRSYYGNYGTISFLIETRGIGVGLGFYERRVVGQYIAVEGYLDYIASNPQEIINAVNTTRQEFIDGGKIYGDGEKVILDSPADTSRYIDYFTRYFYNMSTGEVSKTEQVKYNAWLKINESREAPTAYIVPLGETFSDKVIEQLEKNGIKYYTVAPGSAVNAVQFLYNNGDIANLDTEKEVVFENGAIVATSAQEGSVILGTMMEPIYKISTGQNASLVMSGIIEATDGKYPIYRYEHDLESDGTVKINNAPTYIKGDMDNNGIVNDQDAIYLLFHVYFDSTYPITQPGDINKDEVVNDQDAIYLLFYVYFPDKYPL
ncbi:MAG: succinylglutamate desuccinylase/aspartoacylase family protein [Clostridia bacterium]|nr:succinylglutamate desuccinylase/aspartoacylase family protein [Clostridia bacterium]